MPPPGLRTIEVSVGTILKILGVILAIALTWYVREIVALFVIALFLSALIRPFADWARKYRVPRSISVLMVYLIVFGILGLAVTLMIPTLVDQTIRVGGVLGERWIAIQEAVGSLRQTADQYSLVQSSSVASVNTQISNALSGLLRTLTGLFGGIAAFVIVLVLAFYLVTQEARAKTVVRDWIPLKYQDFALHLLERLQKQMSRWFIGQLSLSAIIATMYFVGLSVLGVEGALVLALFGGLVEFVPYLGPILGGIPIVFVAFTQAPMLGILTLALLVVIQQAENHLIVPKVMQRAVGLNPLISILAMLTGARLFGLVGALLAIPLATATMVVIWEVRDYSSNYPS